MNDEKADNLPVTIRSKAIRMTAKELVGRIMQQWLRQYGWILIIPMSICGALAVYRWEWIIVGLMILLLIYPFVLAMLYFNYGTKKEYLRFIQPLEITLSDNGLDISFEDGSNEHIPFDKIKNASVHGKDTLFVLKTPNNASICIKDTDWDVENINNGKKTVIEILNQNGMTFA